LIIGNAVFETRVDQRSFTRMVKGLDLTPPVLIKPNWGYSVVFTEAEILDWALSAIDGDALVVESYGWARTKEAITKGWEGSFKRSDLRRSDKWFLEFSGIGDVLKDHGVQYLNITEEVWAGRIADPGVVRDMVDERYGPLHFDELYSAVPRRIFELRGGSLLSLAKLKLMDYPLTISLTVKNFFGMIPGPRRGRFHGEKDSLFAQAVIDINKVYRSFFSMAGVVEAVFTASRGMTLTPEIYRNLGLAWASMRTVELDTTICTQLGIDLEEVPYLRFAAETLEAVDFATVHAAQTQPLSLEESS